MSRYSVIALRGRYIRLAVLAIAMPVWAFAQNQPPLEISPWTPLFKGIQHATGKATEPRLQVVNALRVNLDEPGIAFTTTPSNDEVPGDTDRRTGEQFMKEFGVQVAVNAHFYSTTKAIGWKAELHGLAVRAGEIVSELEDVPHGGVSLLISKDNQARFEKTVPGSDLTDVWTALESWPLFIVDGQNHGDPTTKSIHPRTAIGLSEDRQELIIITIDGRQPGYSEGATYFETARWLIAFGAHEGINLDGGGSTHLWVNSPQMGMHTLNKPTENRAVGSHLGIFAAPLDDAPTEELVPVGSASETSNNP